MLGMYQICADKSKGCVFGRDGCFSSSLVFLSLSMFLLVTDSSDLLFCKSEETFIYLFFRQFFEEKKKTLHNLGRLFFPPHPSFFHHLPPAICGNRYRVTRAISSSELTGQRERKQRERERERVNWGWCLDGETRGRRDVGVDKSQDVFFCLFVSGLLPWAQ